MAFDYFRRDMAGYREAFIQRTARLASALPTSWLFRLTGRRLILPFYHAISDESLPHIRHLYPVKSSRQFVSDLDELLKHFEPIDLPELLRLIREGREPRRPAFLLSFDDGLREFYEVVAPILLRKGVPAICFLNTSFVDNRDLFFRYKASLLIEQDPSRRAELLAIKYHDVHKLDVLAEDLGYSFNEYLKTQNPYLSSDQIRDLIDQGFYFGAHSVDHPEYRLIGPEEQWRQTSDSIQWVVEKFDLDYRLFSFPFTDYEVKKEFIERLKNEQLIDLCFGGAGIKNEENTFHLQRIPLELSQLSTRQIINSELLYYLFKAPFGKNMMRRQ